MPENTSPPTLAGVALLIREWAAAWGLPGLEDHLSISFSPRLRRSLGRCTPSKGRVALNQALGAALRHRLAEVLCHEVAHVAAYCLYGRVIEPHGPEWAELVASAGFTPHVRLSAVAPIATTRKRSARLYEHRCPVCHTVRLARRTVPQWRCAECQDIGLDGELVVTRVAPRRVTE